VKTLINNEDQNNLFKLIADNIEKDISCFAIGGTAMMFYGYKETTKDIDLVFHSEQDKDLFIKAIKNMGYEEKALFGVYSKERIEEKNKPQMFSRGDERIDLFTKKVFSLKLSEEFQGRFDFIGDKKLIMYTPSPEWIIALKIITNRDSDFADIITIGEKEKKIDWGQVVDIIIKQPTNWLLLDLEENMQKLKHKFLIKKEYFDKIYKAFDKKGL
jgi:hypothetical protein